MRVMSALKFDHVAVAVHSIKDALPLYRDALGGEYLMGGEPDGTWRWVQFRFPGGRKVELIEPNLYLDQSPGAAQRLAAAVAG